MLVTFCPLCGTGIAFDPVVNGRRLTFGVPGLLYNSDLLMYDRQTELLWSQLPGRAIAGPLAGTQLAQLPVRLVLWKTWRADVNDGCVLSDDTGYGRDYRRSPYGDYDQSERLSFPVFETSRQYHPKTWVVGLTHNGNAKVWPFPELAKSDTPLADSVGGRPAVVSFDPTVPAATIRDERGRLLVSTQAFWFAWYAFHPDTAVFKAR